MKLLVRLLILFVLAFAGLQLFFVLRVGAMAVLNPQSTAFERSQAFQLAQTTGRLRWSQDWQDSANISDSLKRAVIASEDDGFSSHDGVDWEALEKAWVKNSKADEKASKRATQLAKNQSRPARPPKIVGGSTITQQLAKNLFLSGERT
ncbi:MAG: monofunctional biosynthetic peptidoglycan transglycosylase, partial [Comamonadaceae bacterium]